jgi:hypothetical protein
MYRFRSAGKSGSHYSTIQVLEASLPEDKINLSFAEGLLFRRMELLIDHQAPAVSSFSAPYYFAEQLGFRKVIDTTFMIATMIHGDPNPEDLQKFSAPHVTRSATSTCAPTATRIITGTSSPSASTR